MHRRRHPFTDDWIHSKRTTFQKISYTPLETSPLRHERNNNLGAKPNPKTNKARNSGRECEAICRVPHKSMPWPHLHSPGHLQRHPKLVPHFTEVASVLRAYIRVTQQNLQGTHNFSLHFSHNHLFQIQIWALKC